MLRRTSYPARFSSEEIPVRTGLNLARDPGQTTRCVLKLRVRQRIFVGWQDLFVARGSIRSECVFRISAKVGVHEFFKLGKRRDLRVAHKHAALIFTRSDHQRNL